MGIEKKPSVVCILGMHRSGTSLFARVSNLLGVDLGPEDHFIKPATDNPKGFWENEQITALNEEILHGLGGSWHEPPIFTHAWENSPELTELRQRATTIVQEHFASVDHWGWKDPRTCLTLPFWSRLLPPLTYVFALRNPVDVARSLERRDGFSFEKGIKLWLTYVKSALQHTAGERRDFFFYEDFLQDGQQELVRLSKFLRTADRALQKDVKSDFQTFVDEELQHHHSKLVDTADEPRLEFSAKALYLFLRIYVNLKRQGGDASHGLDETLETVLNSFASQGLKACTDLEDFRVHVANLHKELAAQRELMADTERRAIQLSAQRNRSREESLKLRAATEELRLQLDESHRDLAQSLVARERLKSEVAQLNATAKSQQQLLLTRDQLIKTLQDKNEHIIIERDRLALDVADLNVAARSQQQYLLENARLIGRLQGEKANVTTERERLAANVAELRVAGESQQRYLLERDYLIGTLQDENGHIIIERDRLALDVADLNVAARSHREFLFEKDHLIAKLHNEKGSLKIAVEELNSRYEEIQRSLRIEQEAHSGLISHVNDVQSIAELRRKDLERRETEIASLKQFASDQESAIAQIYSSHGWKALTLYYALRNQALPEGSKRRQIAKHLWQIIWKRFLPTDHSFPRQNVVARVSPVIFSRYNVAKLVRHFKLFGSVSTYCKVKQTLRRTSYTYRSGEAQSIEPSMVNPVPLMTHCSLAEDTSISIIIPTKNASEHFRRLLATVVDQKGFARLEVIVVDSGSTDNTVEIAEQFGAKILKILPAEFTHSYARNLGARHASGQFLLFTVQDALPPSDTWLHELYSVVKNNRVAAVSCAEFPAESADLFYRAVSWNHYKFLEVDQNDRIMFKGDAEDHITLRKNGQLSDLACFIPKDIFRRYEYKVDYGEDLDLGVRLIRDGHCLAFLGTNRIIHSHNRPAYYYLKRGYVENLFVPKIFPDYPVLSRDFERTSSDIVLTQQIIASVVAEDSFWSQLPIPTSEFSYRFLRLFNNCLTGNPRLSPRTVQDDCSDPEFEMFLKGIVDRQSEGALVIHAPEGFLAEAVMGFINVVLAYIEQSYEIVDSHVAMEFKSALHKAFAYQCGAQLAGCFLKEDEAGRSRLHNLNAELSQGV